MIKAGRPLILLGGPPLWRDFFCLLDSTVQCAADAQAGCALIEARLMAG